MNTTGDVSLTLLQVPRRIAVKRSSNTTVQVVVEATGTTAQLATVSLEASSPAGVNVQIAKASITKEVATGGDGEDAVTRFVFSATISGTQKGRWAVNWTAKIASPQNAIQSTFQDADPDNDVLTATTQVVVNTTLREGLRDIFAKMLDIQ